MNGAEKSNSSATSKCVRSLKSNIQCFLFNKLVWKGKLRDNRWLEGMGGIENR